MAGKSRNGLSNNPLVSIVIPVFNNLDFTRQCLESIRQHTDGNYEVLVVDNASSDGTGDYLESAGVRVITMEKNTGFPPAVNAGIRQAQGKYVCLLNNDTIMMPGWLSPLVKHLEKTPRAAVAGPMQVNPDGIIVHVGVVFTPQLEDRHYPGDPAGWTHREPLHIYIKQLSRHPPANVARSYPAMNFGCALVRGEVLEEIGLLDEETFAFPGNYEDIDWCLRARKAGHACDYRPRSRIVHIGSGTQLGLGEEMKEKCVAGSRENLQRFLAKWKDEPEELFSPPSARLWVDEYFRFLNRLMEKRNEAP